MKPATALTIAGSDSSGGAGIQADLKTFAALEVHGLSAIASVTAQNTRGVEGISNLEAEFVGEQIDAIMEDFNVEWAKTGMLSNTDIIDTVIEKTEKYDLKLVVDPVMVAASGASLLEKNALPALEDLIGKAKLVTPNIEEANKLADIKIKDVEDMREAAEKIARHGTENILIKGGHLENSKVHNLLLQKNEFVEFETERVPVSDIHGTGCTFSSAITAELAKGRDLPSSVKKASDFMISVIERRINLGEGNEIVNPMSKHWKLATEESEEAMEVQEATKRLINLSGFERLIPEVGVNIAMAPMNAQRREDIVGLTGRMVKVGDEPYLAGNPAPGGSEHIAKIVLTTMKHDPQYRAAMNIKFSEKIRGKCRDLGLDLASFDRKEEPPDVDSTMGWGTEKAIENFGGIPDAIYDEGAVGKEPMIRLLGKKATDLSEKAVSITKELEK